MSNIEVVKGKKIFTINPNEVAKDRQKWNTSIVGQVVGNNASFLNMKKFAEQKWNGKGLLEVQRMEEDVFVFRFQLEESKQEILDQSPMPFGNKVLFLWPWDLDKPIQRLHLNAVPVWVQFPKLRPHYLNAHVLGGLGSLIGKPLFMDRLTTTQSRLAYARICVEISDEENPPSSISYLDEHGNLSTQEVKYEWMPAKCAKCKTFGHNCEIADMRNAKTQLLEKQGHFPQRPPRKTQQYAQSHEPFASKLISKGKDEGEKQWVAVTNTKILRTRTPSPPSPREVSTLDIDKSLAHLTNVNKFTMLAGIEEDETEHPPTSRLTMGTMARPSASPKERSRVHDTSDAIQNSPTQVAQIYNNAEGKLRKESHQSSSSDELDPSDEESLHSLAPLGQAILKSNAKRDFRNDSPKDKAPGMINSTPTREPVLEPVLDSNSDSESFQYNLETNNPKKKPSSRGGRRGRPKGSSSIR